MRAIGLAAACWAAILALAALGDGLHGAAAGGAGIALCLLLVLGPAALALPAGQRLGAPLWALETIVAWAVLGYALALLDPSALGRGLAFLLLLPALFGALASPSLLLAAYTHRASAGRLRRQGYLLAALPCGLLLLRGLDALAPLTAILFTLLLGAGYGLLRAGWQAAASPVPAASASGDAVAPAADPAPSAPAGVVAPPASPLGPARPLIVAVGRGRLDPQP